MQSLRLSAIRPAAVTLFLASAVTACGGGASPFVALALFASALAAAGLLPACKGGEPLAESNDGGAGGGTGEGASVAGAGGAGGTGGTRDPRDGGPDGGRWERCCVNQSITECFCPTNSICNFGLGEICSDGTCRNPGDSCLGSCWNDDDFSRSLPPDAKPDSGSWLKCCLQGAERLCMGQGGCNYTWMRTFCNDGTCFFHGSGGSCGDAGVAP